MTGVLLLRRKTPRWTALDPSGRAPDPLTLRGMAAFGRRFPREGRGFWYALAITTIWPLLVLCTRYRVRGGEHIPSAGGVVVVSNHLSFADPTTLTSFVLGYGRVPRYLAKASLWKVPLLGSIVRSGRHIAVHRGAATAGEAYRDAVAAVRAGECVAIFPEGTFSDHPDRWPMRGKTGAARVALETGAPVIPVANWGTHRVLPAGAWLPRPLPVKTVDLIAGPPVDLRDLAALPLSKEVLYEATARIMAAVTTLLGEARGEAPPVTR